MKKLKKLIEFLPVSRRKYAETIEAMTIVVDGLMEADLYHSQIETRLIQDMQKIIAQKPATKKKGSDPAFQ
ncbi:unnamed protein product [marine sediment metagenome]|uniref:Uncharacterized protein n=1 Tax=marine sediment metagenome TaxID=412755 RepID=X1D0V3_9ZZZZ